MDIFSYHLIAPFLMGIVFMSAIYNIFIYLFLKNRESLFYFFMQISMVVILIYHYIHPLKNREFYYHNITYDYISLVIALFATLFVKSFFNTKESLPNFDKILNVYILIIFVDMLYFPYSFLRIHSLYSFSSMLFLIIAFLRYKDGFKPSIFFLIGWIVLIISFLIIEYYGFYLDFDPMLFGSVIEAVMLALAIAYKIYQIDKDKKLQTHINHLQNRAVAIGGLIADIAHQWRQPLTDISYTLMNIEAISKDKEVLKRVSNIEKRIEFLSQTMNNFINFYKANNSKEYFSVYSAIKEILEIVNFNKIDINIKNIEEFELYGNKNYFQQAILNILINSKEAFGKNLKNAKIDIKIYANKIEITDNAGGISTKDIKHIFELYYTTKENGSGLGLYLTKKILKEKFGLSIFAKSVADNTIIIIKNQVPCDKNKPLQLLAKVYY